MSNTNDGASVSDTQTRRKHARRKDLVCITERKRSKQHTTSQGNQARRRIPRRVGTGGADDGRVDCPSPSDALLYALRMFRCGDVSGGTGEGGGGVLSGGSPASGVAQAGNEEGGQNVNYCPPPSTPFTACAHLLYARTPAACCRCGCLF